MLGKRLSIANLTVLIASNITYGRIVGVSKWLWGHARWSRQVTYRALEAKKLLVFGMMCGTWLGRDHSLPTYPTSFCPWVSLGDIMGVGMGEIGHESVELGRFIVLWGEFLTLDVLQC